MSYFDDITPRDPPPITDILSHPRYQPHFVDLHLDTSSEAREDETSELHALPEDELEQQIEKSIRQMNDFCKSEYQNIVESLNFIARRIVNTYSRSTPQEVSDQNLLRFELDQVSEDTINLEQFVGLNSIYLLRTITEFDKANGTQATSWFAARLENEYFSTIKFERILMVLSDLYHTLVHGIEDSSTWDPPESFDRQTTKFWVKPEHLLRVKLEIAKHVPILVFGQTQGINKNKFVDGKLKFDTCDGSPIISVYFDNDDCNQYHNRLFKEEGATLIRIRWYGTPLPGKTVFVEQKTHHEEWIDQPSVKERFQMDSPDVKNFLEGKWHYEESIPKLKQKGVTAAQISSNWALANEIQNNVLTKNLHPVIRTAYLRTAFQLTKSNQVRFSLDTELQFIRELPPDPGNWIYMKEFPQSEVLTFPLGVLEIKLHEEPPEWVKTLVKSGYLIRAEGFSKFQHATGIHYPDRITTPPDWFDNPIVRVNATGAHGWYDIAIPFADAQTHMPLQLSELKAEGMAENIRSQSLTLERALQETLVGVRVLSINPKQKFDPGFFLANERIFLKWTRFTVTFGSLAVVLFMKQQLGIKLAAAFMLLLATVCATYGIVTHYKRKSAWSERKPFTDPIGLTTIVFGILTSLLVVVAVIVIYDEIVPMKRLKVVSLLYG